MALSPRILYRLLRLAWRVFFSFVLLYVALLGLVYFLFLQLSAFPQALENWLSSSLQQPVRIASIETSWSGIHPQLRLARVQLLDAQGEQVVAHVHSLDFRLDLVASVLQQAIISRQLSIEGAHAVLEHDSAGNIRFKGFVSRQPQPENQPITDADNQNAVLQWFLQQQHLALLDSRLEWREVGAVPAMWTINELSVQRQDWQHVLHGEIHFPLEQTGLPFQQLQGLQIQGGVIKLDSLSQWQGTRLLNLAGKFQLTDIQLQADQQQLNLPALGAQLSLNSEEQRGWRLDIEKFHFATEQQTWPLSAAQVFFTPGKQGTRVEGQIGFMRLDELMPLLEAWPGLPEKAKQALQSLRLRGQFKNTRFSFDNGQWWLRTQIERWHNAAWQGIPALNNWSGLLEATPQAGSLQLNTRQAELNLTTLYAHAFQFDQISGRLAWTLPTGEQAWALNIQDLNLSNADIAQLNLSGSLGPAPESGELFADFSGKLSAIQTASIRDYIPDRKPSGALNWMQHGLPQGLVKSGTLRLHGPLSKMPFRNQEGIFDIDLQTQNVQVDFKEGWPNILQANARVQLLGPALKITAQHGLISEVDILSGTEVIIPDMWIRHPVLTVDGKTRGSLNQAFAFLANSPLRKVLETGKEGLQGSGPMELALKLFIPLSSGRSHLQRVNGDLHLLGNGLRHNKLDIELSELRGLLRFDENVIDARGLNAKLFAEPIVMDIQSKSNQGVQVSLQGQADGAFIDRLLTDRGSPSAIHSPLLAVLEGTAPWEAQIRLPSRKDPKQITKVDVHTSLLGIRSPLPAPLGKPATQARDLWVQVESTPGEQVKLKILYAKLLNALLLQPSGKPMLGALRFGEDLAELPADAQAYRVTGNLDYFSLSAWQPFVDQIQARLAAQRAEESEPSSERELLDLVDVHIAQADAYGLRWPDLQLQAKRDAQQAWRFNFAGKSISGQVRYQPKLKNIDIDLAHLHFYPITADADNPTPKKAKPQPRDTSTPQQLPALNFNCEQLYLDDRPLGQLQFNAYADSDGWHIPEWRLHRGSTELSGNLLWSPLPLGAEIEPQSTRLSGVLSSPDFGRSLQDFGYKTQSIRGGDTRLTLNVAWAGGPGDFGLDKLRGQLDLQIGKGQIVELEPGPAGRMFGLFDLGTMTHRLSLDFSDVLEDGFGFNQISGEFFLQGGYAYTDALDIHSPAADVRVSGRTGLVTQTYEQQMIVTPHASNALPVAGAVFGGPAVGALTLFLQHLIQEPLDSALNYRYVVTGSWQDPQVQAIAQPEVQAGSPLAD